MKDNIIEFKNIKYKYLNIFSRFINIILMKFFLNKNDYSFPCSKKNKCLVRTSCKKPCKKIIKDINKIEKIFLIFNRCPDCGSKRFYKKLDDEITIHIKCIICNHWFEIKPHFFICRLFMDDSRFYK